MKEPLSSRIKSGLTVWGPAVIVATLVSGTGPCYDDECNKPGQSWCKGEMAVRCSDGMGAYQLSEEDCAAQNLTCVEGRGEGPYGDKYSKAWCLDVQTCDTPGSFECGVWPADGSSTVMRCTDLFSTPWFGESGVDELVSPADLKLVMEPLTEGGFGDVSEAPLPCVQCLSTCGCGLDTVCRDGWCVPSGLAGESDDDLVCCGRERGTSCPKGQACEKLDGTQAVCTKGAACDPCETASDCESDLLGCVATWPGLPTVCLEPSRLDDVTLDCREDLGQAWKKDACGTWLEVADSVPVGQACREGTDQSWSFSACQEWIEVAKDCGPGYRCEDNECILRVPEIEVSPTLLSFGSTPVSVSKTLELTIGNIGDGPLLVNEILVTPATELSFELSQTSFEVAPSEIASIDVTFTPASAGSFQAKLLVHSNDEDEPEVVVLMNGKGQ